MGDERNRPRNIYKGGSIVEKFQKQDPNGGILGLQPAYRGRVRYWMSWSGLVGRIGLGFALLLVVWNAADPRILHHVKNRIFDLSGLVAIGLLFVSVVGMRRRLRL